MPFLNCCGPPRHLGFAGGQALLLYALFNLVEVGLSFAVGNFSPGPGGSGRPVPLLVSGLPGICPGLLRIRHPPPNAAMIWPLFALYGLYSALTRGVQKAFVADLVHPERRGGRSWHILHADWVGGPASQLKLQDGSTPSSQPHRPSISVRVPQ